MPVLLFIIDSLLPFFPSSSGNGYTLAGEKTVVSSAVIWHARVGTEISKRQLEPDIPVSRIVIPVMQRISRMGNKPRPDAFP
ncbi:MAG: hypothetical protein PHF64_03805, partial [Methanoregula sp.]|nr:hypothetical protein [Methanoregula sp.]